MRTKTRTVSVLLVACACTVQAETLVWRIAVEGNWIDPLWIAEENDLQFPWLWPVGSGTNIRRVWPALGLLDTVVTINASSIAAVTDDLYVNNNASGATVAVALNSGGILSTNHTSVGYPARGEFNHNGGLHRTGHLWVGAGVGVYRLSGIGQLDAPIVEIGGDYGGTGVFFQTGGTHTVNTRLRLGHLPFSTAVYEMHNGSLNVQTEVIAGSGRAGFYQVGGTHTITGSLKLGEAGPSPGAPPTEGIYELGAGSLTAPTVQVLRGTFNQSGGTNTVNGVLTLGAQGSLDASYTLSGGVLSVGGINNGTAQGNEFNGISYLNLDGGVLNLVGNSIALDTFNIGDALGSNGSFTLLNGMVVTAENETIGVEGAGAIVQNGGTHTVAFDLILGDESGAIGEYTLNGGALNVDKLANGSGTGTFTQTGGTNNVNSLDVAPTGTSYSFQGGQLNAGNINLAANNSAGFNFTGGTLSLEEFNGNLGKLFNNGGVLSPGNSAGVTYINGYYDQSGSGTLNIELGGTTDDLFDVVTVQYTATLAGRLEVSLLNDFVPVEGNSFDILSASILFGKFDSTALPSLGANLRWLVTYDLAHPSRDYVRLTVVPPVSADFDRDGDVDLDDLERLEHCSRGPDVNYDGKCNSGVHQMDFDDDSDIDLSDFSVFQRCFSGDGVAGDPTCAD